MEGRLWENKARGRGETKPAARLCQLCGCWFLAFSWPPCFSRMFDRLVYHEACVGFGLGHPCLAGLRLVSPLGQAYRTLSTGGLGQETFSRAEGTARGTAVLGGRACISGTPLGWAAARAAPWRGCAQGAAPAGAELWKNTSSELGSSPDIKRSKFLGAAFKQTQPLGCSSPFCPPSQHKM